VFGYLCLGGHTGTGTPLKILALALQRAANDPSGQELWKDPLSFQQLSSRRKQPSLKLPGNWSIVAIVQRVAQWAAEFRRLGVSQILTMSNVELPGASEWGHLSPEIAPAEIIERLKEQTERAIHDYAALPEGPEPCNAKAGYFRVSVTVPLTTRFFDQLMNGATGYRAHYSVGIESGEAFNLRLVEAIAPIIVRSEHLYRDRFERDLCQRSLCGRFSKFWFPKEITDPSAQSRLEELKEELRVVRWMKYWRERPKPWKGLLVPIPESRSVLLNGTFVNDAGEVYEQKPGRSKQIFDCGWT
jgi:hypothetical protein